MRVLCCEQASYDPPEAIESRDRAFRHLPCDFIRKATPDEYEGEADALVVNSSTPVGREMMERLSGLKLVLTSTSGYDHIDVEAARERDIRVCRCPLARRDAVIETSIAMALGLIRRLEPLKRRAREGKWVRGELPAMGLRQLRNLTVGIVGYGVIGRRAVKLWESLGPSVRWHDPAFRDSTRLDRLLETSDLISLHCSLTEESHHLINEETLGQLKNGAIVINTARGECVDVSALLEADHLGGVGLDVFPVEPWPELVSAAQREDIWLTPHAAGYFDGLSDAVMDELVSTLEAWMADAELPFAV